MKLTANKLLSIAAIILLILGAVYYTLTHPQVTPGTTSDASATPEPSPPPALTPEQQIDQAKEANAAGLSQQAAQMAQQDAGIKFTHTFSDAAHGFSFGYPDPLKAGSQTDDNGNTTILVQDTASHVGFQVYITPWSNSAVTTVSADDVAASLPDIQMHNPTQVSINGTPALAFQATDATFGDSRQVWFIRKGFLYQVSSYSSQDPLLEKVLSSWRWK